MEAMVPGSGSEGSRRHFLRGALVTLAGGTVAMSFQRVVKANELGPVVTGDDPAESSFDTWIVSFDEHILPVSVSPETVYCHNNGLPHPSEATVQGKDLHVTFPAPVNPGLVTLFVTTGVMDIQMRPLVTPYNVTVPMDCW